MIEEEVFKRNMVVLMRMNRSNNEPYLQKNKKVFVVTIILVLTLLATNIYIYSQYNKVSENNRLIKFHLTDIILSHLPNEKDNIEGLITIIASDKPPTEKTVNAQKYSNLIAIEESLDILLHTSDKEPEEWEVLLSLKNTLASLGSFLNQIDGYYGFMEQQPFELKKCGDARIEDEEDILNELNKFLEILDYPNASKLSWESFVAYWPLDNPYSCNY